MKQAHQAGGIVSLRLRKILQHANACPNAQRPGEKKGLLVWLVEFTGKPSPPRKGSKTGTTKYWATGGAVRRFLPRGFVALAWWLCGSLGSESVLLSQSQPVTAALHGAGGVESQTPVPTNSHKGTLERQPCFEKHLYPLAH